MYCRKCGAENEENARFCKMCGEKIQVSEEALEKTLEKNMAEKPEAKKRSWKKPVLAGIVTVAFIAAIVSVVLFGMGRGSKESVKRKPDKDILLPVFQDEKWGYKNIHNEWVIQPQFEYADLFTKKGVALALMNEETCLIDKKGKIIANIHLDNSEDGIYAIYDYEYDSDAVNIEDFSSGGLLPVSGYTFASDDTAAAFIDEKGNVTGATYEEINDERSEKMRREGYYLVREGEKAGYVNGKNETVIPLVYDDLGNMGKNGLIRAEVNGRWG